MQKRDKTITFIVVQFITVQTERTLNKGSKVIRKNFPVYDIAAHYGTP